MQNTADEEKGWKEFQEKKNFEEGGVQKWAEGLLDDQKPLEVLYRNHPQTFEPVIIMKYDTKVAVVKANLSASNLLDLLCYMPFDGKV
jgi:hypothetical protein